MRDINSHYVIDPTRFRFRKLVRILALVFLFINNLKAKLNINSDLTMYSVNELPIQFKNYNNKYLVTQEKNSINIIPFNCPKGLVVTLNDDLLKRALKRNSYQRMCTRIFLTKKQHSLFYRTNITISGIYGKLNLSDVCIDLTSTSFCVPLIDRSSPLAYAVVNEIHWYNVDAKHSGKRLLISSRGGL